MTLGTDFLGQGSDYCTRLRLWHRGDLKGQNSSMKLIISSLRFQVFISEEGASGAWVAKELT